MLPSDLWTRVFLGLTFLMTSQTGAAVPAALDITNTGKTLPVKFVVVTMFEIGADEGDQAGEFQLWKTRKDLNQRILFPHSHHDLFYNHILT